MKPGEIEQVSEDLASNLPCCPRCSYQPVIYKRLMGIPPRPQIMVCCVNCVVDEAHEPQWRSSLFEAVNIWSLTAKLLGSVEALPERVEGSTYYDEKNGEFYVWQGGNWVLSANAETSDVPF